MQIQAEPLTQLTSRIFAASGCDDAEAHCIAHHLVDANLCGHDSHGVIRVGQYLGYVKANTLKPGQQITVTFENDCIAVVDGNLGFGQTIGEQAMKLLTQKATKQGLALMTLGNTGHVGRLGAWAERLAERDLISIHFVSSTGLGMLAMPFGGSDRRLSISVICMCVPVAGRDPILLDTTTTTTAEGKLQVARNKGVPVPEGFIVDKDGNPTTDANDFYDGGAILPFFGHKGHGFNILADMLCGALSGSGCTRPGTTTLINTMTSIAINPSKFTNREAYIAELKRFSDWVTGSPPSQPDGRVLLPGQIELETRAERRQKGIPLDDNTWSQLTESGLSVGLDQSDFEEYN